MMQPLFMHSIKYLPKLLLLGVFTLPLVSFAEDVQVAPPLFDLEMQARDVVTKEITITNDTPSKQYVYATVNEIAVDASGDIKEFVSPVMDARQKSITSWVEITRARIELDAGQATTVPMTVRVHPYAEPGEYHAFIGLVTEANRPLAEAKALRGDAEGVILKVTTKDTSSDALRITSLQVDRFIINEAGRVVMLQLKNDGDKVSVPTGEIIFYNSRGEEIAAVPVNSSAESIEAGKDKTFNLKVPFNDSLGRYKANVTVRYGQDGKSAVFDTVHFYLIPYKILIVFFVLISLFSIVVTYLIRRVFYDELHSDDETGDIPLYVRNDREHQTHDHDIHIAKK